MATIQDVAKLAGVSTATVSRVLNDNYKVSDKRRQQVLDAVEKLNFRPNIIGRNLSRSENRTILVVSGAIDDDMLRGAHSAAKELGYDLILSYSPMADDKDALKYFENGLAGGILFINFMGSDENIVELCRKYPVVQCAEYIDFPEACLVSIHDDVASYQLTEHLIKQGRRRLAFLGPKGSASRSIHFSLERERGFRQALADYGIAPDAQSVCLYDMSRFQHSVEALTHELISRNENERPDALVCAQDISAVLCINTLRDAGVNVPHDIAVTGFDDRRATVCSPRLTTVAQPFLQMGAESVKLLVSLMHDPTVKSKRIFLEHEIILRGSTEPDLR